MDPVLNTGSEDVKSKANQDFHKHENYQMDADNDLLPVPHNTAVTNGMRFDTRWMSAGYATET
ncbi:hypothetical protein K435DRAFT_854166 [Dendrothele bispora CBS 962.96]|uniref:Uncharacterized protein n=1 Tax=Dendrothele bispora (strain CBS 962.96) TaxID=1314807 RepID=A0A4V4HH26_DENBC|nr:hypothetical protein K435DRAFT_854166 [Dendrothele bispora CBS 962.96]